MLKMFLLLNIFVETVIYEKNSKDWGKTDYFKLLFSKATII